MKLEDFLKRGKNSEEREAITVSLDGADIQYQISKISPEQIGRYNKIQESQGLGAYFAEILLNHVFDAETGEAVFTKTEIIKSGGGKVVAFFEEYVPHKLKYDINRAILAFSDLKPTQAEIDYLKN